MMIVSAAGLWNMDTSKLLATILNKVFCIYNEKEYRKYFIQLNLDIEDRTKKFIVYSADTNKYSSNMYYHYYIYLSIMPYISEIG